VARGPAPTPGVCVRRGDRVSGSPGALSLDWPGGGRDHGRDVGPRPGRGCSSERGATGEHRGDSGWQSHGEARFAVGARQAVRPRC
jgi:hypothetical protein